MVPARKIQERSLSKMKYFRWLVLACIFVGGSGCQARRAGSLFLFQDGIARKQPSGKQSGCDTKCDWQQECKVPLFHETRWRTLDAAIDD